MTVKQISVFMENKPGQLAAFTDVISKGGVNLKALSLAEAEDFGIVRVIVDDVYNATSVLKAEGYVFSITDVIAIEIPDEPGALNEMIHVFGDNGVNLEYMYAFAGKKAGVANMIFRVKDIEKVDGERLKELGATGVPLVGDLVKASFSDRAKYVHKLMEK